MVAFIIIMLVAMLPCIMFIDILIEESKHKKEEKNRLINKSRDVKTNYEFNAFDFVENEKIRLENEHKKRLKKITKKYGDNILLYKMSPNDLDAYMREKSLYHQKIRLLHEGLMNFYKDK